MRFLGLRLPRLSSPRSTPGYQNPLLRSYPSVDIISEGGTLRR
jgi:hypothetical protein